MAGAQVPERGRNRTTEQSWENTQPTTASRVATSEDEDYVEGEFDEDEDDEDLSIARASTSRVGPAGSMERRTAKVNVVLYGAKLSVDSISYYRWQSRSKTFQLSRPSLARSTALRRNSIQTTTYLFLQKKLAHT